MTDYTKGPWETGEERPQETGATWIWIGPAGWRTRTARVVLYAGEEDEQRANASLISAAPDLLEALKALRNACIGMVPDCAPMVDAAILKAEGRSK